MKLVDRQLLRELVGPFAFGLAAFSSVFFAGSYLLKLTQWLMNGMPLGTALQVFLLYLPGVIVYTLPMAMLLSVLLGVGRLSADSEIAALFAGGISVYRLVAPIVVVGIAVSLVSIGLNEFVAPKAAVRNQRLQAAVFQEESRSEKSFTMREESTGTVVVVGGMDERTKVLKGVTIIQYLKQRPAMLVYAERAEWKGMNDPTRRYEWKLYNGFWTSPASDTPGKLEFAESTTRQIRRTPDELALFQRKPEEMSFTELTAFVRYLKANPDRPPEKIRKMDVDRWNKLALPLSSLVFALLAAPLAIRPQRTSSSVGLGLSILVVFVYWIVWHYTSALAVQGSLDPPVGAFAADVMGIIGAVFLLRQAAK